MDYLYFSSDEIDEAGETDETKRNESGKRFFPQIDRRRTGIRLKTWMRFCHLRPSDLQEYLGLSCVQTVYRWLEGINVPSIDNLYALSFLFSQKIDRLLIGSETSDASGHVLEQEQRLAVYYDRLFAPVQDMSRSV